MWQWALLLFFIGFPCFVSAESLWNAQTVPTILSDSDTVAVELGVKFIPSVDGAITGIRFYKGEDNIGTHVGSLWDANGQLLAQVTFANETASGWQQADFSEPVSIITDTIYIASYHAPNGRYSADSSYFSTVYDNGSYLTAPASGYVGGNGVYQYGPGGFPTDTFNATNYWVDVVFTTDYEPPPPLPTGSVTLAWDASPEPEVGGYRIHYGTQSGIYNKSVDVGNVLQAEVIGLSYGETYYFAAVAYPAPEYLDDFVDSEYSNEVSRTLTEPGQEPSYLEAPTNVRFIQP